MGELALYLDATYGISGDMLLGALSSLVDWEKVVEQLGHMTIEENWEVKREEVIRCAIKASKVTFELTEGTSHRHLKEIFGLIDSGNWPKPVSELAKKTFLILAEAEAKVHGLPVEQVHFHEVGALDSILDIAGFAWCYYLLGQPQVYVSALPMTQGTIKTQHGLMPVPAPATLELIRGLLVYQAETAPQGEAVTPTGAAILKAVQAKQQFNLGVINSIGYGAGSRNPREYPNLLRALLVSGGAQVDGDWEGPEVTIIEATIDDMDNRLYPAITDKLFRSGVLDVTILPGIMKKGRPGYLLRVMTEAERLDEVARLIFSETTTIGLSFSSRKRFVLSRKFIRVFLGEEEIKVKISRFPNGQVANISPEYSDCVQVAEKLGEPIKSIISRALAEAYRQLYPEG